ncbi:MAG: nucleoside hydrolase [Actinomycetota bacterium]
MTRQVLIDTDPGVDDAMAILMAFASPELEVVGLTTIFGNAATDVTTANAQRLLDVAGRPELPVARGASRPLVTEYLGPVPQVHGHNGLGDAPLDEPSSGPTDLDAADLMWQLASARPGELTLLALGPLTNLGTALQRHPELADLVAEVVLMGGNALGPGNATPVAEANVNNDPEAADLVFGAGWDVTMVGLDVTHRVTLGGAALDRILAGDSPGARLLAGAVPLYRGFFEETNGIDGIYVHDPSAVAYLVEPSAFITSAWPIRVETESFSRGKTWPNLGNTDEATPPAWRDRPLVDVCVDVDATRVRALVEERLAGNG